MTMKGDIMKFDGGCGKKNFINGLSACRRMRGDVECMR